MATLTQCNQVAPLTVRLDTVQVVNREGVHGSRIMAVTAMFIIPPQGTQCHPAQDLTAVAISGQFTG